MVTDSTCEGQRHDQASARDHIACFQYALDGMGYGIFMLSYTYSLEARGRRSKASRIAPDVLVT